MRYILVQVTCDKKEVRSRGTYTNSCDLKYKVTQGAKMYAVTRLLAGCWWRMKWQAWKRRNTVHTKSFLMCFKNTQTVRS
jgi:hypothetical protein